MKAQHRHKALTSEVGLPADAEAWMHDDNDDSSSRFEGIQSDVKSGS